MALCTSLPNAQYLAIVLFFPEQLLHKREVFYDQKGISYASVLMHGLIECLIEDSAFANVFAVLKLPGSRSKLLPYLITLFPPLVLALLDPEIFFKALDFAGTYGGNHFSCFLQLSNNLNCGIAIYTCCPGTVIA